MPDYQLYAVFADIHANYQALLAAVDDVHDVSKRERMGEPLFISLGDVVDYGPQPNECVDWVRHHAVAATQGNHDAAVGDYSDDALWSNVGEKFWPITLWTRRVLDSAHRQVIGQEWRFSRRGPAGLMQFTLFHGNLETLVGKIEDSSSATTAIDRMGTTYGLFGHTHYQGYFTSLKRQGAPAPVKTFHTCRNEAGMGRESYWRRMPRWGKAIFNPGSVGQPRRHAELVAQGEPRESHAAYLLLHLDSDGRGRFQFRRAFYDVDETVRLLEEISWPNGASNPDRGNSIYKSVSFPGPERRKRDPAVQKVLDDIATTLPRLVRDRLIPELRGEQRRSGKASL